MCHFSYLEPDRSKSGKHKTAVIRGTCNPRWYDVIKFENVSLRSLKNRCLELTVWDHETLSSNEFLGGTRLNLGTGKFSLCSPSMMSSSFFLVQPSRLKMVALPGTPGQTSCLCTKCVLGSLLFVDSFYNSTQDLHLYLRSCPKDEAVVMCLADTSVTTGTLTHILLIRYRTGGLRCS